MPQMAPMMWMNLLITLFISMILLKNFLYFTKSSKKMIININKKTMKKTQTKNWLW